MPHCQDSFEGKIGRSAAWSFEVVSILFMLWALTPYIFVFSTAQLAERIPAMPEIPIVFFCLSVLILGLTFLTYITGMTGESSTEALVYVFVPIYLYVGSVIIISISIIVAFFLNRSRLLRA